jgi:hypothetical protein
MYFITKKKALLVLVLLAIAVYNKLNDREKIMELQSQLSICMQQQTQK